MESALLFHTTAGGFPSEQYLPEQDFQDITGNFDSISLRELNTSRAILLSRIESKHLMTADQCVQLLEALSRSFSILEVRGLRWSAYETTYLDNRLFITYMQHHNGKANRYKLRFRRYGTTQETYLEIKKKTNRGTTEKKRLRTAPDPAGFSPEQVAFLRSEFPFDYSGFRPVLATRYERFTLVSKESPERITFDCGISFSAGGKTVRFPDLIIAEVKQERGLKYSRALLAIHSMGIAKRSFSKYCIGVALLYPGIKYNRFKEILLFLSRLTRRSDIAW